MHTPPHNLFLPRLKSGIAAQIADALVRSKRTLLDYAKRMYRLDAVVPPQIVQRRPADAEEQSFVEGMG